MPADLHAELRIVQGCERDLVRTASVEAARGSRFAGPLVVPFWARGLAVWPDSRLRLREEAPRGELTCLPMRGTVHVTALEINTAATAAPSSRRERRAI